MPLAVHMQWHTLCIHQNEHLHCHIIVGIRSQGAQPEQTLHLLRESGGVDAVIDCNLQFPTGTGGVRGHSHRSACWLHAMPAGERQTLICWRQKQIRTSRLAALHHVYSRPRLAGDMSRFHDNARLTAFVMYDKSWPHCRTPPYTLCRSCAWCTHSRAPHTWPPGMPAGSSM